MRIVFIGIVIIIIAVASLLLFRGNKLTYSPQSSTESQNNEGSSQIKFAVPKKSAHYESNTPEHGSTLPDTPVNVVINFNFDLATPSEIRVYSSGVKNPTTGTTSPVSITTGATVIDTNKLSMRVAIDPKAPDDKYTVDYKACWPDKSCHDGSFEFAIDRSLKETFEDLRGNNKITINIQDTSFIPQHIIIKSGTEVTWVNNDLADHYVNTDSHPAHTYFQLQNSKALSKSGSYAVIFNTPGYYPYHCSAHEEVMKADIIVE